MVGEVNEEGRLGFLHHGEGHAREGARDGTVLALVCNIAPDALEEPSEISSQLGEGEDNLPQSIVFDEVVASNRYAPQLGRLLLLRSGGRLFSALAPLLNLSGKGLLLRTASRRGSSKGDVGVRICVVGGIVIVADAQSREPVFENKVPNAGLADVLSSVTVFFSILLFAPEELEGLLQRIDKMFVALVAFWNLSYASRGGEWPLRGCTQGLFCP